MRLSSSTDSVFQRLAPGELEYRLEYQNGWNSITLKRPQKRWRPRICWVSGTKKDVRGRLFLIIWWSRGDLNPRPPVLRCRYYMLSRVY